jgi:hydrogenase/urease accessory protein HupE
MSRGGLSSAWRHVLAAWLLGCAAAAVQADVFRPAYLELREAAADGGAVPHDPPRYHVLWKVPAMGELRLAARVKFPPDTTALTPPQAILVDSAYVERWQIVRPGGLVGQTVSIEGNAAAMTDVIVRVERLDGSSQVERLLPHNPQFTVKAPSSTGQIAWSYLLLGVGHILGGVDHLLFVLALLLIVSGVRRLVVTITAFTVAHSFTLVAATLGWVRVPGPPVEAVIALSIVFVAAEIVRGQRGRPGLTARSPWLVAFAFGLLHGFGFAGALAEIGLPQKAIPLALLTFNVGVEIGQLIFVTGALALRAVVQRAPVMQAAWMRLALPYAIGTVATFWLIERVDAFL